MRVDLIQASENPIETIAQIASTCYDSSPADAMKLVKHLYRNGHHSVFEHIFFTFRISGISRACSHQLVRHRLCSFTQRSQRYCDEHGFEAVMPESIIGDEAKRWYRYGMQSITEVYDKLRQLGVPAEDARFILPNACETEIVMSLNLRELIHLCNERMCIRAQWEIRELSQEMAKLVPEELRWMLVPKCQSGFLNCPNKEKCKGAIDNGKHD